MTPNQIRCRRVELGLTIEELALALGISADEMRRIEAGESDYCLCAAFEEAFAVLEQRAFGIFVGA
jgi:predicted transcriptional regulator